MIARTNSNLTQWIKFFLVGVIETSKESIQVFKKIIDLKGKLELEKLPKLGSKIEKAQKLINRLFQFPITDVKFVASYLNVSPSTANRLVNQLVELNILAELTGYKRNRKYIFKEYFEIFQRKTLM